MFGFSRRNGVAVLHFTAHRDDLMTEISPREKSFSLVSGPPSPSTYPHTHNQGTEEEEEEECKEKKAKQRYS